MNKGCIAALVFCFLSLVFLYQIAVLVFVLPIDATCDYNSTIPNDPAINLSMEDWIYGGMIAGIVIVAITCGTSRTSSNSDCWMYFVGIVYILYNMFTFIWSIIGLIMYNDYYQ